MPAFSGLTERLQGVFQKLRSKGKLSEADVSAALREVRLALLEADVNYGVVKDFVERVKARAVGQEVLGSLTPAQQVVKIVYEELTALMGQETRGLAVAPKPPTVVMLVGLQGSGKTTTAAKLALYLKGQGRRPWLVAADVYRPAAVKQLEVLGQRLQVPVFSLPQAGPVEIATTAVARAPQDGADFVLLDTAGRLHVDAELMAELVALKEAVRPQEILLVVDAMTGQDAVRVAEAFHQQVGLTGIVLTKLDGDSRGGAALSVRAVTGCPVKFVGLGEKVEALEPFHPERLASRILGMGDVLTLIEKAQAGFDREKARELEKRLRQRQFTLEDFLEQLQEVKKMGSLEDILQMLPGTGAMKELKNLQVDEREFRRVEAIIRSMTPQERRDPEIINASRKRRIAGGSGTSVQEVNRLLKQFAQVKKLMHDLGDNPQGRKRAKALASQGRSALNLPFWR